MSHSIPPAGPLPQEVSQAIQAAAHAWRDSPARPRVSPAVLGHWDRLVDDWLRTPSAPLLVRKGKPRGVEQQHRSGRVVVAVDNSPAHWALGSAILGLTPTLHDVLADLEIGELPVAFALTAAECREEPRYTGALARSAIGKLLNKGLWKVCHIEQVGIGTRTAITDLSLDVLHHHFASLMKPRNMFVVPKTHGGFGELPEVIEVMGADASSGGGR